MVAFIALTLADEGKLELDKPLNSYLGNNYDVGDDERINRITARRVLSHTTGFPNWRNRDSEVLPITFEPGERFRYSGEGFVYLGKVIEEISGKDLNTLASEIVFAPLGMKDSSLDWKKEFFETKVFNHDSLSVPRGQNEERGVNAAASLHTTAADYAKFVRALLNRKGLSGTIYAEIFKPQVFIDREAEPSLAWGLGWGLEIKPGGNVFWHWGDNGYNRSFVAADMETGRAFVVFTNSANGLSFLDEILSAVLPGEHASSRWLGYERWNSPSRRLFKAVVAKGATEALAEYNADRKGNETRNLSERQMNRLGYDLLRMKRTDDAIAVFEQNTKDHPDSGNTWDSLAESYMEAGKNDEAIRYYKRSLSVDPSNKNAEEMIQKLSRGK